MRTTFLKKGACVLAAAALAGCMVPAAALADGGSSSGTGTTAVTSSEITVQYDKDCSWTATYPTSVTMAKNTDGTASGAIDFTVKGLIDVDHQVSITPSSETITLTGDRHSGTLSAAIAGCTAAADDVNATDGATVSGLASATKDDVTAAAVDTYKGTTTFNIQCAEAITAPDISNVTSRTAYSLSDFQSMKKKAKSDSTYATQLNTLAESGNAYLENVATDSSAVNATLVNYDTNGLTFMTDAKVAYTSINNGGLSTGNFGNTTLYTELAEGGEIYNKFNSDILSAVTEQSVKVATNYNSKTTDAGGGVSTLAAQKLWLPSYTEILGNDYNSSYVAGSSAEGTQMDAFKSTTSSYHSIWASASASFWLRSAHFGLSSNWLAVDGGGGCDTGTTANEYVRPCFTL